MSSTTLFVELVSTACSALGDRRRADSELRRRVLDAVLVVVEPEAQDHGSDQPERDEPEEEPVREASGEQAAAVAELTREGLEPEVGARDALARLDAEIGGALTGAGEALLERTS